MKKKGSGELQTRSKNKNCATLCAAPKALYVMSLWVESVDFRLRLEGSGNSILLRDVVGVLRGNTIRGNTTRNSERKMALWEGLWEGLWKTSENL